jgi:hypothetical protein
LQCSLQVEYSNPNSCKYVYFICFPTLSSSKSNLSFSIRWNISKSVQDRGNIPNQPKTITHRAAAKNLQSFHLRRSFFIFSCFWSVHYKISYRYFVLLDWVCVCVQGYACIWMRGCLWSVHLMTDNFYFLFLFSYFQNI